MSIVTQIARRAVGLQLLPRASVLQARQYGSFEDREKGEERVYFRREEERMLRNLLNKVKKSADTEDKHAAQQAQQDEFNKLKGILGKYNVSEQDMEALIKWKYDI